VTSLTCFTAPGITSVVGLEQLPSLWELRLIGPGTVTANMTVLATHPALSWLNLQSSGISNYTQLASLTNISMLDLRFSTSVTPDGALVLFTALPKLKTFFGSGAQITGSLADIAKWPAVTSVHLGNWTGWPALTGDLSMIAGTKLVSLDISGQTAVTGNLTSLAGMNFSILRACSSSVIGDLSSLTGMPMKDLCLSGTGITGSLASLSGVNMLMLSLPGTSINPDVSLLAPATNPQWLDFTGLLNIPVNLASLSWFTGNTLTLNNNIGISCADVATLIAAVGAPPVDLGLPYKTTPVPGSNCTQLLPDLLAPFTMAWADNGTAPAGSGTWDGRAQINEVGSGWCVALPTGAAQPSSVQVQLGSNFLQVGTQGIIQAMTAAVPATCTITGLTPLTTYDFYFAAQDVALNLQATPTKVTAIAP